MIRDKLGRDALEVAAAQHAHADRAYKELLAQVRGAEAVRDETELNLRKAMWEWYESEYPS